MNPLPSIKPEGWDGSMHKRAYIRRRVREIARDVLGYDFEDAGPHLQLLCILIAEQDWEMKCLTILKHN